MREISIHAITGSKKSRVLQENDCLKVYVRSKPEHNKANAEIVKLLQEFFATRNVRIVKGMKSRNKTVIVD